MSLYSDIDPEMVESLRRFGPMVDPSDLVAFRGRPPLPQPLGLDAPVQRTTPGLPGEPAVNVRVLNEAPREGKRAALVWMHGGGFVGGDAGIPSLIHMAARQHDWLVVSVEYRLAPEARFPAALHDNYAALRWVHDNAEQLGVDPQRVAIGGTSAGAGHAAMLAIAARDWGMLLAFQLLIYPALDDRAGSTGPATPGTGKYVWTAQANRFAWSALLGQPAGTDPVPAGSVPARVENIAGLAPAFIGVGTLDLFFQESIDYATRLAAAGVAVQLEVVPAAYHGFERLAPEAQSSQRFNVRWLSALTRALGKP
ncbi:alpha/beta hydrolase [Pseudomonas chlororaphis]|uniref:alpha/beta hydrolase n=1 Tax=Pseudomonas chlororaphis TaxID=587753 RepID=UPI001B311FA8|nr:alpha/beta hydrolase [Pseudomonas chlororaphis]MBP5058835.1 alpha/beta hydrolase [Pseudomonas chlororaphis]MBP5142953.1 alpha/beta hydrolase [Pseudomonas chlororaphis]QTT98283.1 alpha/beta hydrolase [Pseudomonas chlororaphis]